MTKTVAQFVLWALLLVLAVRMTMTETAQELLSQMSARFAAQMDPKGAVAGREIGPAVTTGLAAITYVLAAAAAWCAASAGALSRNRIVHFSLVVAMLALGLASSLAAANKFVAIVGLSDIGMALLAGWAVAVLCHQRLLGGAGRRLVAAAIVAILTIWTAKGIYQRTCEFPDYVKNYYEYKDESIAQALGPGHSTDPDDPEVKLIESRMKSNEVFGYVTLSNVMGAGMVGLLAVLAGLIAARRVDPVPIDEEASARARAKSEIPLPTLWIGLVIALGVVGVAVLFLTASRGASVIGVGVIAAIIAGQFYWRQIAVRRRFLLMTAAAVLLVGICLILGYGLARDSLPSKSLMFRWHYWTASVKLIKQSPWLGVGLHNFGDYYTSVKRSSSPEDVKDPHSFFIRLAAEMGIPAAILVGILIVWRALRATRPVPEIAAGPDESSPKTPIVGISLFCCAWWLIHQAIAETPDLYSFELSAISAVLAASGFALAFCMLNLTRRRGMRMLAVSALLGAVGMLLYDQINMALVTGPVATLFWMLLGFADSYDTAPVRDNAVPLKSIFTAASILLFTAGLVTAGILWWPTLHGKMPWDASPFMEKYLQSLAPGPGEATPDMLAARKSLDAAIARSPRSIELRHQLMLLKMKLSQPVASDIRAMLLLDRANARIRMNLALPDTDLPAAERITILRQALYFDSQLPPDDVVRLTAANRAAIEEKIASLQNSASHPQ